MGTGQRAKSVKEEEVGRKGRQLSARVYLKFVMVMESEQ
jgi:hypothetical protein